MGIFYEQIYTLEPDNDELISDGEPFPIRAQCLAVFSPDPTRVSLPDVHIREIQGPLRRMEPSEYRVTFYGCGMFKSY